LRLIGGFLCDSPNESGLRPALQLHLTGNHSFDQRCREDTRELAVVSHAAKGVSNSGIRAGSVLELLGEAMVAAGKHLPHDLVLATEVQVQQRVGDAHLASDLTHRNGMYPSLREQSATDLDRRVANALGTGDIAAEGPVARHLSIRRHCILLV
jgi:hypothetical protein